MGQLKPHLLRALRLLSNREYDIIHRNHLVCPLFQLNDRLPVFIKIKTVYLLKFHALHPVCPRNTQEGMGCMEKDAFFCAFCDFLRRGSHLLFIFQTGYMHLFRPQAEGCPGTVIGNIAAAKDHDPSA